MKKEAMASKEHAQPSFSSEMDGDVTGREYKANIEKRGWAILRFIGFEMEPTITKSMRGRFVVSEKYSQPFGVLHGGMTAYIAETLASIAGYRAANFQNVAGIEINLNHLQLVPVGREVLVTANPFLVGDKHQVWEVKFEIEKIQSPGNESTESSPEIKLVAIARVTLVVGVAQGASPYPPAR